LNLRPGWSQELWRIALLLGLAGLVGVAIDKLEITLLLALLAYLLRNLYQLHRLADWLGEPEAPEIPIHFGLWGDIYARIARTSQRNAQREKRLSGLLNEYTASTSALPDAAVALDREGRIRWFNEAASRLLGLLTGKDIGQPLLNLVRTPEVIELLQHSELGRTVQITAPGNPARQLELRVTPYGDGQTLLLAQDVTDRLQHERMRKDFVANVSHELRTPLTVISGFIENLQGVTEIDSAQLKRPLDLMEQQAARMRQIVEDLLLLARLESDATPSHQARVDVAEMLRLVADECSALREETASISYEVDSSCQLLGDEKQLRSALTNLVVNAVNHTGPGGNIRLRWQLIDVEGVLSVTDEGEGIAAEHLPRLTERFYRVDAGRSRERGGTGLGLAIVKHILNRHDARLEVHSELGKGSEFSCIFPASRLLTD
jgi:two-component system phosphate regulon sensor histidine kinase PhoR